MAVEENPLLVVEKIHIEQAKQKLDEETGTFDPTLNLRGLVSHRDNLVASRFYPTGLYVDADRLSSIGLETRNHSGGRMNGSFEYRRLISTSNTQTLSPQYSANLTFTFSQSLLRDFGRDVNNTKIRVAQKGQEIADRTFYQRVSELVQQVESAYWNLFFLNQDLEAKRRSLEAAQGLFKQSQDLFAAGQIASFSVSQARAGVATHEEDVLTADNELKKFEDRLKVLLWLDLATPDLVAADKPRTDPVSYNVEQSLQMALLQRPEIQGLQKELEQREIETKFASNQTLPRLDVVGQYGRSGLSGLPNLTCVDPTSTLCVPVGSSIGSSVFANDIRSRDSLSSLVTNNFNNWSVEVKLQIPLGNHTAKAQLSEANLRYTESSTRLRYLRDQVEMEIRDSVRETLTAKKRIDSARETITYLEDQLDGTRKRFEAGLASSYDVLEVFDQLDKARTNEFKAVMDFNIGQSKVRFSEASILDKYNIELKTPPRYTFEPKYGDR